MSADTQLNTMNIRSRHSVRRRSLVRRKRRIANRCHVEDMQAAEEAQMYAAVNQPEEAMLSDAPDDEPDTVSSTTPQPSVRRKGRLNINAFRQAKAERDAKAALEIQAMEVADVSHTEGKAMDSPETDQPDDKSSTTVSDNANSAGKSRLTDKDWADRLRLEAIRDLKGKRYYLSDQQEIIGEAEAIQQIEDAIFRATGNTPEDRQVQKILKAIALLSEERGDCQYPIFYRVGKTTNGHIAIDLCNNAKQYLVLDSKHERIEVCRKDQLNKVTRGYKAWFYCDSSALPLLEPEHVNTVVDMVKTFNYAIVDADYVHTAIDYSSYLEANQYEEEFKAHYSNLSEDDFLLLRGWLAYTLITAKEPGNVFPLLFLQANMGEGKTVIFRQLLHWFTDPRTEGVVRFNRNLETTGLLINQCHALLLDNIRKLQSEQSDFFCNTATGSNEFKRRLYENGGLFGSELHGAIAMNGIHNTITEPDLISRTLFVQLQAPEERLDETLLQQRFVENRPWFFAVVLRDAMRMLYHLKIHPDDVVDNGSRLVRFSRCLSALDCYRTSETLLPDLMVERQQNLQHATLINDPLIEALYDLLTVSGREYRGSTNKLLKQLNKRVVESQRPGWWPANAQQLYYRMRERQNKLRLLNIVSCKAQPELLQPRKGEVVYQISDAAPSER